MSFANEPVLELRRAPVRESLLEALRALDAAAAARRCRVLVGGDRGAGGGARLDRSRRPVAPGGAGGRGRRGRRRRGRGGRRARVPRLGRAPGRRARAGALRGRRRRLRERRAELTALQVRECAKPWREADADVCEAIDFLEYYARAAVELDRGRELVQAPGERNTMRYVPRGVAAVIAPWNFPLAIPCGMTAAALAAGNAVVLKPAEQSPAQRAGARGGAARGRRAGRRARRCLPGYGEAGAALVRDPRVHVVAFTGLERGGARDRAGGRRDARRASPT